MIWRIVLSGAIGYCLGCIISALIVGKLFGKIDIRDHGSGNAGSTNVQRVLGWRYGFYTLAGDALKGVVAVAIGWLLAGEIGGYVAGVCAVIGHNWPAFSRFKGGKGIATSVGVVLMTMPLCGGIVLAIGLIVIFATRYVSLGAVIAAGSLMIVGTLLNLHNYWAMGTALLLGAMAIFSHRANIKRLIGHTERKIGTPKKEDKGPQA